MNKENNWDHVTAASMVEGLNKNATCKEMVTATRWGSKICNNFKLLFLSKNCVTSFKSLCMLMS